MVSVRCTGAALCRSTGLLQPHYVLMFNLQLPPMKFAYPFRYLIRLPDGFCGRDEPLLLLALNSNISFRVKISLLLRSALCRSMMTEYFPISALSIYI